MRTVLVGLLLLAVACRRPSTQFSAMMTPANQPDDYSRYLKSGDELVALGNAPSWSLTINPSKGVLYFKALNGDSITAPVPERQRDRPGESSDGIFRYKAQSNGADSIHVSFKPESCMDSLSGQHFDYRVEVSLRGKAYKGWGVSLRQLTLLQDIWVLTTFQGNPIVTSTSHTELPRLEISLTEGRVTGTTGCNRLHGSIKADTRQILFGPLITTKMACPGDPGEFEHKFLSEMIAPFAYQIADGKLTLLRSGTPIMVFKKVD